MAHRLVTADPDKFAVLDDAQQLALQRNLELTELVDEECAGMGQRKNALAVFHRSREGALDVSEEVALHQTLGDRRAVQRDERSVPARAGVVDRAGDELLAG